MRSFRLALAAIMLAALGCGAVYPEVSTQVRAPRPGAELIPPPPEDLYFLRFASASIPPKTRDGRQWDAVGGAAPDPFVKLFVNGHELFRTPIQSNTLRPTWPDAKKANYRIPKNSVVKIEMWDSNALTNHPICVKVLRQFREESQTGQVDVECDSGARITLTAEPAHARIGLGLRYEFRTQSVYVTRVAAESPAARVGLSPGDQIRAIQGRQVEKMDEAETRSAINANAPTGLTLSVKRANGEDVEYTLKEGPIYPLLEDDIPIE
jgi:membrane-associated protease RseP (regulator of RpoE activity)